MDPLRRERLVKMAARMIAEAVDEHGIINQSPFQFPWEHYVAIWESMSVHHCTDGGHLIFEGWPIVPEMEPVVWERPRN